MTGLSEVEIRVLGAIDEDTMLSDLADLVAIPSVDGTPEEAVVQRWCAERLAGLGGGEFNGCIHRGPAPGDGTVDGS